MIKTSASVIHRAKCVVNKLKELYPSIKPALIYGKPHEFLFAVILSAQSTDKQVNKVTMHLFEKYKTLDDYCKADPDEFIRDISSIGLNKSKGKNILETAKILESKYAGKVPDKVDELISLPGVGRKTANVVMSELFGKSDGIAVDTHVVRLSQKYGLSSSKTPEKIEQDLMKVIPKTEWSTFSLRMVQYGRDYCKANCKECPKCPLWECVV